MKNEITKIKTYWDKSPNSRSIIYFTYKDIGVCRMHINEGDNYATIYGLYVDEKQMVELALNLEEVGGR